MSVYNFTRKYPVTAVFRMILWNFAHQPSLTEFTLSSLPKVILWFKNQSNTLQENAWGTNKLLDNSSLSDVNSKHDIDSVGELYTFHQQIRTSTRLEFASLRSLFEYSTLKIQLLTKHTISL